ncbi:UvrD-helicase domain-containing protein [Synechococcus sp. M16CYN]|uniref:UvrD-helicase domain-containing protein n=1 Tax=Synechococcus sp. M16CYN TaxID=3103139 RepID=UPI00324E20FF
MVQPFNANTYPLKPGVRLLEASAGTGKTFVLAHLALRLITEASHPPEALLVVTYTEAAAKELRSRIGRRLQQGLLGLEQLENEEYPQAPDPVLAEWWAQCTDPLERRQWIRQLLVALERLEGVDIVTIHAFCRRSLQRLILDNGAAIEPQLEGNAAALRAEVVQDLWQQELLSLPEKQLRGLRLRGLSPRSLCDALARLEEDPHPQLAGDPIRFDFQSPLHDQLRICTKGLWQEFQVLWKQDCETLESGFRFAAELWKAQGYRFTAPYSAQPRTDRCAMINRWVATQDGVPSLAAIAAIEKPLKEYFHPGSWSRVARKCGEKNPSLVAPALQTAIAALWDEPLEQVWRYLLERGLKELDDRRRSRGTITFAGFLAAMDPGEDEADWLIPLQERYRAVMVDEFQDTDPVQWRLLRRTFGDRSRHLLLMVGDPKQAIYRFRGGDLGTYFSARAQVDRIDYLLDNFRTTPLLMEGLNKLMEPGMARSGLEIPAVEARSEVPAPKWGAPLQLLEFKTDSITSRAYLEEVLPKHVAAVVFELLQNREGFDPADLCILVSRHQQALDLRRALSACGIPTRLVTQCDVFESEAALVIQRLLDALVDPSDARLLRLFACSWLLDWSLDSMDEEEKLNQLAEQLRLWGSAMPKLGLMGCLSKFLKEEQVANLSEQGRMLADLQQVGRLVQDTMYRHGLDVATAADWLRRERLHPTTPVPEMRQPHSDQADCAVAVVTVHHSKGLEYPVVICPYLWQAPRQEIGPLWRQVGEGNWLIAVDPHWGAGHRAKQQAFDAAMAEAERLAYVAATRARSQLLLVWARSTDQEGAPLPSWLFGAEAVDDAVETFTRERLFRVLAERNVSILHRPLPDPLADDQRWHPPQCNDDPLALGATPGKIDQSWGRASYSAWVAASTGFVLHGQGRDPDLTDKRGSSTEADLWPEKGPLSDFPRGAVAGDCLHRILEQIPFEVGDKSEAEDIRVAIIDTELKRAGLDSDLRAIVMEGLDLVLTTQLGGPLAQLQLKQLGFQQRHHELNFDLPVDHIRTSDLVKAFRCEPNARFGGVYIDRLATLAIDSRGFLTGSIDLVFCDLKQSCWWVLDWKSNWIGERGSEEGTNLCGPRHYHQEAMQQQMIRHHYPLQAHIYLLALHRHLSWRLPAYKPEHHLGGYVYVFLRGMPGITAKSSDQLQTMVGPGRIVEPAPLQRILALDRALSRVS